MRAHFALRAKLIIKYIPRFLCPRPCFAAGINDKAAQPTLWLAATDGPRMEEAWERPPECPPLAGTRAKAELCRLEAALSEALAHRTDVRWGVDRLAEVLRRAGCGRVTPPPVPCKF